MIYYNMKTVEENFKEYFPHFNGRYLDLYDSDIEELPLLPDLEILKMGFSKIKKIPNFPELRKLYVEKSDLVEIPELQRLLILDLGFSKIKKLPNFPNLRFLYLGSSTIEKLPKFEKLYHLSLRNNTSIQKLPKFPNLEVLDLGFSKLKTIPIFKNYLSLDLNQSCLEHLPYNKNTVLIRCDKKPTLKNDNEWVISDKIGSRDAITFYNIKHNRVYCGCFIGTFSQFKKRVHWVYDEGDKYRIQYDDYINLIESKK